MFNPVIALPIPAALAVLLVPVAAYYLNQLFAFLDESSTPPWPLPHPQPTPEPKPARGRHRPENIPAEDRRDWASITANRLCEAPQPRQDRLTLIPVDPPPPLTAAAVWVPLEIEAGPETAGLPDREPVDPGPLHVTADIAEITAELELVTA